MRKKLVIALLVLGAVLLLVFGTKYITGLSKKSGAQNTSDSFVQTLLAGNSTDTYNMLAPSTQSGLGRDDWQATVTKISSFFRGAQATLVNSSHGPTLYLFEYSIQGSDGTYTFSVLTSREKDAWAIRSFNSSLNS